MDQRLAAAQSVQCRAGTQQRIKMDPGGYMRWHRLWKHESFYTLTPLLPKNHTHKSQFSSSRRRRGHLQIQTRRLQLGRHVLGQDVTTAFCETWCGVRPAPSKPPTPTDPGLSAVVHGGFRDLRLPAESQNAVSEKSRRRGRCWPGEQKNHVRIYEFIVGKQDVIQSLTVPEPKSF